jgi:hypothetical protein
MAFVDKDGQLSRIGFKNAVHGKNCIMLEDISTTGGSALLSGRAIEQAEGTVSAYYFIWIRDNDLINESTMGAPVYSLIEEKVSSYAPGEHPMWGIWPIVIDEEGLGHGAKFSAYPGPRIKLLS